MSAYSFLGYKFRGKDHLLFLVTSIAILLLSYSSWSTMCSRSFLSTLLYTKQSLPITKGKLTTMSPLPSSSCIVLMRPELSSLNTCSLPPITSRNASSNPGKIGISSKHTNYGLVFPCKIWLYPPSSISKLIFLSWQSCHFSFDTEGTIRTLLWFPTLSPTWKWGANWSMLWNSLFLAYLSWIISWALLWILAKFCTKEEAFPCLFCWWDVHCEWS